MNKRQSLSANVFFSAISWLSSLVFLVIMILAARFLGEEIYGQLAFAYSLVALFEVATDLGMKEYLVREVARARERTPEYLGTALMQKAVLSIITVLIIYVVVYLSDFKGEVKTAVRVLTLAMLCKSFKFTFRAILTAHERFSREALIVFIDRALLLIACTSVLVVVGNLLSFVTAFFAASAVSLVITYFGVGRSLRKVSKPAASLDPGRMWIKALPFGLTAAALLVYFRLDSVMLSLMRNDAEVGWYNAAYRLTEGMVVIPTVLYYALFPRLSVLHQESRLAVQRVTTKACKFVMAIAVVITTVGIVEADRLIALIYGARYIPAADALSILLVGIGFMFLWNMFVAVLNATNRPQIPLIGVTLGAALNVGLNFVLIPRRGFIGASISTVIAEVFLFVFLLIDLRRQGYGLRLALNVIKPVLSMLPAFGLMWLLSGLNLVVVVLAGIVGYGVTLLLLRFLDSEDIDILRRAKDKLLRRSEGVEANSRIE